MKLMNPVPFSETEIAYFVHYLNSKNLTNENIRKMIWVLIAHLNLPNEQTGIQRVSKNPSLAKDKKGDV